MATQSAGLTPETFRFFRELGRNNSKEWMDANRDRYQEHVVQVLRRLFEALAPPVLALNPRFDTSGRTNTNFSRINRDIRFAKDKTPYRAQMYVMFPGQGGKSRPGGQLYAGILADRVTIGFRIYAADNKTSALAQVARPRAMRNPKWVAQQRRRLGRKYESYWYSMQKREWTKHDGWPLKREEWTKLLGWIVRRKLKPSAATRPGFARDVAKMFRELYPLFRFTSLRS